MTGVKAKLTTDDKEGCSIIFFVACQKALKEEYGDRAADPDKLNEMVNLLGRVERLYMKLEKVGE